ncbi:TPA: helix-turn-helix transcriptional regulator [Pseudomonas putida]|nr:helix-turn-helix transcriptional regulator [Pseudomonas putida]
MADNAFGRALRSIRTARGLSQQDFMAVVSREHISRLERGVSQPNLEVVEGLASVLGVHPLSLLALSYQLAERDPTPLSDLFLVMDQELRPIPQF